MNALPHLTSGASSESCLDAGLVCSIWQGRCTECGMPEDIATASERAIEEV